MLVSCLMPLLFSHIWQTNPSTVAVQYFASLPRVSAFSCETDWLSCAYQADIREPLIEHLDVRALGADHAPLVFAREQVLHLPRVLDQLLFLGQGPDEAPEEGQGVVLLVWVSGGYRARSWGARS